MGVGYSYSEPPQGAVTCLTCGRMNLGITRAEAERLVAEVNAAQKPEDTRSPIDTGYFSCCVRPRFRRARIGDIPDGATYASVMCEAVEG